ncbi:unnamed protein product [Prorocentrum cordatum]|uniref:Uncharacterized protein n=1 Tax=Prorocentrum cordatum TaxID=2364126 RepID=A0ABN9UC61_9DINO|nr:unnamed protein product [Polarella glacialis]|mmetsp:Transcript_52655/g.137172  ORF Transcript_52655/g.137172 Transcript_52655/m.137172 type:complete len:238 (+) Transcript_52655:45-758(+)
MESFGIIPADPPSHADSEGVLHPFYGTLVCLPVAVLMWDRLHNSSERQPDLETSRRALLLMVAAIGSAELYHVWVGYVSVWTVWVILVCSVWGFIDAVLRYPIVYDPGSFFVIKQCVLLCLKVVCMACGLEALDKDGILRLLTLFVANATFPLLYTLALPISDDPADQQLAAYDAVNVDIVLRVLEFTKSRRRKEDACIMRTKCVHKYVPTIVNYFLPTCRSQPSPFGETSHRRRLV